MKYTKLGKSDLNVSRICMGCMGFGNPATGQHSWTLGEEQSREIIRHGLESGINFYDTAIAYQNGTSEQYVGKALRDFARREEYVIATKFTPRTQEEIDAGVSGQEHIQSCIDQSLVVINPIWAMLRPPLHWTCTAMFHRKCANSRPKGWKNLSRRSPGKNVFQTQ